MNKLILLAALFACALGGPRSGVGYSGPTWPRLPLDVILTARNPVYSDDKVVGGEEVSPNSIPWQVALLRSGSLSCGGSIYKDNIIICAKHCVDGLAPRLYSVVAGEHDLRQDSGEEQTVDVEKFVVKEDDDSVNYSNDIALIFLSAPLNLSVPSAQPVTLPAASWDATPGQSLVVSGWGSTRSGGLISQQLRKVTVPAVSQADCQKAYGQTITGAEKITPDMICAGDLVNGGVDSCQGDSGGPLVTTDAAGNPTNQLVGIVSWGSGCADKAYPGVYSRVTSHLDWIAANTQ